MSRIELSSLGPGVVIDPSGRPINGISGHVYLHGTTTGVTIWSDESGGTANERGGFTTDPFGHIPGWIDSNNFVVDIAVPPAPPVTVRLLVDNVLNVITSGAVGNNVHDDTAAFRTTLSQAEANGGTVFAPAGHYKLTGALVVTASNVLLELAPGAILDFSSISLGVGVPYIQFIGSDGATINLTQNVVAGSDLIQVAPGSEPADATYVRLGSSAFWSGGPRNATSPPLYNSGVNQKRGEHRIVSMPTGTLQGSMGLNDASLTLTNTSNDARVASRWPSSAFVLEIDAEQISVPANNISVAASTVTITALGRGANGTTPATHNSSTSVSLAPGYVGLTTPTDDTYNTADAAFITAETFLHQVGIIGQGQIIGPGFGTGSIGVEFDQCKHVIGSHGLTYSNWDLRVVSLSDVIETPGFDAPSIYGGKSNQNSFYGVACQYGCQDITINGGLVYDVRHAFTTTGSGSGKSGIPRRIKVVAMHAINTTSSSFDTHPGGEDISFIDCTSENAQANGFNLRAPNVKIIGGHVKYCRGYGVRLRNQSSEPTRYLIDGLTIQSPTGNAILYTTDGSFTTLQSTINVGDIAPFTIQVASTVDWFSSGTLQVDSEWMTYTVLDDTHFTITGRAQDASVAAGHSIGAAVNYSLLGVGANTDYIVLDNIAIQDVGYRGFSYASIRMYSNDAFPLKNIRIGTVHIKNQASTSAAAIQLQNVQDSSIDRVVILGHPPNADAIRIQNCQDVTVNRPKAEWSSRGTGRLVRMDSGYPWGANSSGNEIAFPESVNAGTGISIDSTCSANRLRAIEGVTEATTPLADSGNSILDDVLWRSVAQLPYNVTPATSDAGVGINRAITDVSAKGGGTVFIPAGAYTSLTKISLKNNVRLYGAGATINAANVAADGAGLYTGIEAAGSAGTPVALTVDAHEGDMQVVAADTSSLSLSENDLVLITTDASRGTLHADIGAGDSTFVVDLTVPSQPDPMGVWVIADELIAYSSVSVVGSQATFTVRSSPVGRGYQGTDAVSAAAGTRCFEFHGGKSHLYATIVMDKGELAFVRSVSATQVTLHGALHDDYAMAVNASIRKITPVSNFEIEGVKVFMNPTLPDAENQDAIRVFYGDNFRIINAEPRYAGHVNVDIISSSRWEVSGCHIFGKMNSDPPASHQYYAIACYDACLGGRIVDNHAYQSSKIATTSVHTCGQGYWGIPRHITIVGNQHHDAGVANQQRHPSIEVHGGGEHITIVGNGGTAANTFINIQAGKHLTVEGNTGTNWTKYGIGFNNARELHDITVIGNSLGRRALGPGYSLLTTGIDNAVTTIPVGDATMFYDDIGLDLGQLVLVDSEIIRFEDIDLAGNLISATRGYMNTTKASHLASAPVRAYGYPDSCPIDIDLSDCLVGQRAYNQPTTKLSSPTLAGDTTLNVTSTAGFPIASPARPQLAWIEGENSTRGWEPAVIQYTGTTGTTLTNVTHGILGTPNLGHSEGVFVRPYFAAVSNIQIKDHSAQQDLDYPAVQILGYVPTEHFLLEGNEFRWNNPALDHLPTSSAIHCQAHNVRISDHTSGWPSGVNLDGNQNTFSGRVSLVTQGTSGQSVRVTGDDCRVERAHLKNGRRPVFNSGQRCAVFNNIFEVASPTNTIANTGTLTAKDNRFLLPVTVASAVTDRIAISSPMLPTDSNDVWRRPSDCYSVPLDRFANTAGTITAGDVIAVSAPVFGPGPYTQVRVYLGTSAFAGATDIRCAVQNPSDGSELASTGNVSASINGAANNVDVALHGSLDLTAFAGSYVRLVFAVAGGAAGTIRGVASTSAISGSVTPALARRATGYAGGAVPAITDSTSAVGVVIGLALIP